MVPYSVKLLSAFGKDLLTVKDSFVGYELDVVGNYHAVVDYFHEWRCDHYIDSREMVPNLAVVFSVESLPSSSFAGSFNGQHYIPLDILVEQALEAIEKDKEVIVKFDIKPIALDQVERDRRRREFELSMQQKIALGVAAGKAASFLSMKDARERGIFYNPAIGVQLALRAANEAINLATERKQYMGKDYDVLADIFKFNNIASQNIIEVLSVGLVFQ